MRQAASALGVPFNHVKYAKEMGCAAFKSTRVNNEILKQWLLDHKEDLINLPTVSKEAVDIRLKMIRGDREAFAFEADKGKFWPKEKIGVALTLLAKHRRATLQRRLEVELPPKLIGLGVIDITDVMTRTVDEICREWSDRTKQWMPTPSE